MLIRLLTLSIIIPYVFSDYCGDHKVPYGVEVHQNGKITLLCTRPNCHEKKYADCPERASSSSCSTKSSWVGGLTQHADGELKLQCCEYELLPQYATTQYKNLTIHPGEYFEGEEVTEGDAVVAFDLVGNIQKIKTADGKSAYSLLIYRYHCGDIPASPPLWYKSKQWPYWN